MRFKHVKTFFEKHERLLMPATLILGTAVDFVTFRTINIETTFWILGIYFLITALCIVLLNTKQNERLRLAAKFLIQFTFGALLSASLVFYWFSGALSVSWPILLVLVALMISNEKFRQAYLKPVVQLSIFYFVMFSLFSLAFPYAFHSVDAIWFYLSGIISFLLLWLFVWMLSRSISIIHKQQPHILLSAVIILLLMNIFYGFDIIPPIPLSLREAGAYHSVVRSGNGYTIAAEQESLFDQLVPGQTIHVTKQNRRLFVFASIFAPTQLNTSIVHEWNFFDEEQQAWVVKDRLLYRISGGREDGYRGYSAKTSVQPGKWRVDVQTERGQTIGRVRFDVEMSENEPSLIEVAR